ncbi:MAG TPA: hypothetical protein ENK85_08465 [Saprospiraceae bacterium]|nr:hypothetical protein [Saprospiraceae bacterium]
MKKKKRKKDDELDDLFDWTPILIEGEDYYLDEQGRKVFTAAYLLKRGKCCGNDCLNCPY